MAVEIVFEKWPDFQLSRARDLDFGSGHTAYRRASLMDLYLHAKFHWNRRNFLWTDGRTHVRTYETSFVRSTLSKCVDLKTLRGINVITHAFLRSVSFVRLADIFCGLGPLRLGSTEVTSCRRQNLVGCCWDDAAKIVATAPLCASLASRWTSNCREPSSRETIACVTASRVLPSRSSEPVPTDPASATVSHTCIGIRSIAHTRWDPCQHCQVKDKQIVHQWIPKHALSLAVLFRQRLLSQRHSLGGSTAAVFSDVYMLNWATTSSYRTFDNIWMRSDTITGGQWPWCFAPTLTSRCVLWLCACVSNRRTHN